MNAPLTINLPAMRREAELRSASFDPASNTIEVIWTAGSKVRRRNWYDGEFDEELVVTSAAVDLGRLNSGAPFLNAHAAYSLGDVIGSVVPGSAKIVRGQGVATVLLSSAAADADIVEKIRAGVIKNISCGYRILEVEKTERDGDVPLHRVTKWEVLELSAVPIGADPAAHIRAEGADLFPATLKPKEAEMANQNPAASAATLEGERQRASVITELATRAGHADMAAMAIAAGTPVDEFRAALLDRMVEVEHRAHPGGPGMQTVPSPYAQPAGGSEFDERRARAIENGILHRVDPVAFPIAPGAEIFSTMPLLEVARAAVAARGVHTSTMSRMQIAQAAIEQRSMGGMHSTADFPVILGNVANKVLRAAYEAVPQTFRPLVRVVTVADFKEVSRAQISEAPQFERVNEHGEFHRGSMGEAAEKYAIQTYGKIIGLTRQAIINDDLSAFDRVPRAFGVQAAQLESDLVWSQVLANPAMGDGAALFHADHRNLLTSGAIGETTVGEARLKMGLQTGLDGKTLLNLSPEYLIVPKALEVAALKFVTSITPAKTDDAVPKEIRNLTVIAEPRLDVGIPRHGIAGSATNYYFATSPRYVDLIELAYLAGAQGVHTETRVGFDVDGVEIKARIDVGAKTIDWRGISKNPYSGS